MGKSSAQVKELQRRLVILGRLEGRAVRCREGVYLVRLVRVRDAGALLAACREGPPRLAELQAALELAKPPLPLTPRLLASAQRHLHSLASPQVQAMAQQSPRLFRRYGELGPAWLDARRERLDALSALARAPTGEETPFARALELVRSLHGQPAASEVERALAALARSGGARRTAAKRTLELLARSLEPGAALESPPREAALAARLRELRRLPGRARQRRLQALLHEALGLPPAHAEADAGPQASPALPLEEALRTQGDALLAELPSTRSEAFLERARERLLRLALAFDPTPQGVRRLDLTAADIEQGLGPALEALAGWQLKAVDVVALSRLGLGQGELRSAGHRVEQGLEVAALERLISAGMAKHLYRLPDRPVDARACIQWLSTLVPHYEKLGLEVKLTPALFEGLRLARAEHLGVLALCLIGRASPRTPAATQEALATLDLSLGLFQRCPDDARDLVATLAGTTPGLGQRLAPDFAAWLGDDEALDRHLHLLGLAGQRPELSKRLRQDSEAPARARDERAYLQGLPALTPAQQARLSQLERLAQPADPAWTRRRLREANDALVPQAYEHQLDQLLRGLLRSGWGIAAPRLTPAWRDALRFFLVATQNREVLRALLRHAASRPGADPAPLLPANQSWLQKARARMDVDAWLAPRSKAVILQGQACTLAVEHDPLQVLQMGVPFGTCLSLEDGINSASVVLNAADANKRVLYLRGPKGQFLGRQLIAVSSEWGLLGYRVYSSLDEAAQPEVEAAFDAFCAELARDCRLPLEASGKPEQLHAGFWYDDGTRPFPRTPGSADADVAAYCQALGLTAPEESDAGLREAARRHAARERGDVEQVLAVLGHASHVEDERWVVERLGWPELLGRVARRPELGWALEQQATLAGPEHLFAWLAARDTLHASDSFAWLLDYHPPSAPLARSMLEAARSASQRTKHFDDHGLEHQTLYALPDLMEFLPIAEALELCDRAEPLWAWVAEQEGFCSGCRESAEGNVLGALERSYPARPDPEAVLRCLASRRSDRLAHRAALHLASLFALAPGPGPALGPPARQPLVPCRPALRALERLRALEPDLDPAKLCAALLRQSASAAPRTALPALQAPPFEALGDLVLQLPLEGLLQPWLRPRLPLDTWRPGPWERAYHRRHPEHLSALLSSSQGWRGSQVARVAELLADLGRVETLETLHRSAGRKPLYPDQPWAQHNVSSALGRAREVQRQLSAEGALAVPARELRAESLDAGYFQQALAEVERGGPALAEALALVARLGDRYTGWAVVDLLARARPRPEAEEFLGNWLASSVSWSGAELHPERIVRLWQQPGLRERLVQALARSEQPSWIGRLLRAERLGIELGLDTSGLLEAWVRALIEGKGAHAVANVGTEAELRRCVRAALDHATPDGILRLYQALPGPEQVALFLAELRVGGCARLEALAQAFTRPPRPWSHEGLLAKGVWLSAALTRLRAA